MLSDLRRIDSEPHANTELVYAHVVKHEKELAAKRAGVGQARAFVATSIIERAAAFTFGQSTITEARTMWRSLSGAAHGLLWPMTGRDGTQQVTGPDAEGIAEYRSGGSLQSILNAYMLAYKLSANGWNLLGLRATAPNGPVT